MKLLKLILFFCLFQSISAIAEVKLSNFKEYQITKTNFQLKEVSNDLNYPWGMTFIDDENLLITEKSGRLLKVNISTGEHFEINLELDIFTGGQGGLLDVLYNDNYVYFQIS